MKFIDDLGITHHIQQFRPSNLPNESSANMACGKVLHSPFLANENAEKEHVDYCEKCQKATNKEEW